MNDRSALPYSQLSEATAARLIATPMDRVLTFGPEDDAAEARSTLDMKQYDFAPVVVEGEPVGRVQRTTLTDGTIGEFVQAIRTAMVIGGASPISDLLRSLKREPFLFVVDRTLWSGIVTASDLEKQAARSYWFLLLADLEMRLADFLRKELEPDKALLLMNSGDRRRIGERLFEAKAMDINSDLYALIGFRELLAIATAFEPASKSFGVEPPEFQELTTQLNGFRNKVVHTNKPLLGSGGLQELLDIEASLSRLLAW